MPGQCGPRAIGNSLTPRRAKLRYYLEREAPTGLAHLAFNLFSTVFAGWLPRPTRSPCFWWCDFRRTSGTTQPSDHFQSIASRFTCAYGVASLGAIRGLWKFSWGHVLIFRTVPSANTLVRWVNENAFAPIVRARPCPTFGRPVRP